MPNRSEFIPVFHVRTPPKTRTSAIMKNNKFVSFSSPSDKILSPITKALIGCKDVKANKKERAILLSDCFRREKPHHQKTLFTEELSELENKENIVSNANVDPHKSKTNLTPKINKSVKTWPSPSDKIVSPFTEALVGVAGQKASKKERARSLSKFSLNDIGEGVITSELKRVKTSKEQQPPVATFENPVGNRSQNSETTENESLVFTLKRTPKKARHSTHLSQQLPVVRYHSPCDEIVSPITKALVGCGGRKATKKQKMKELSRCFPNKQITNAAQPLTATNDPEQKRTKMLRPSSNTPVSKRPLLASRSAKKLLFPLYVEGKPELKKNTSKFASPSNSPLYLDASKFSNANGENSNLPPLVRRSSRKKVKGVQKKKLRERGNAQPLNKSISVLSPLPVNVQRR